jgi:organic radical activating enzyme
MESFLSLQGEGFHQGTLSFFIRIAGCDVGCPWCDVKESWDISENQKQGIDQLVLAAKESKAKVVIITGGEPLMHDLTELTRALHNEGFRIHLETSGAHPLTGHFDWITLSPKKFKKTLDKIYGLANELKVVVANKKDIEWAAKEAEKVNRDCQLFLQAEWDRREKQYPAIYSYIVEHPQWKISLQSHKYLGLP